MSYSPAPLLFEPRANPANALGLYLFDARGNRELLYRDSEISSTSPIPLVARTVPPVLPPLPREPAVATGQVLLSNVYRGLGDVPRGTIRQLRIVQIFPKTTAVANVPQVGVAGEENARAILGTVDVEDDGSAYFEVPAGKPVLFQALDKDGMAYQTMRTITYVQPGEVVSCVGCHENRLTTPVPHNPIAARRRPSLLEPGPLGGSPFSFVRFVQPLLEKHCVRCHGGEKTEKDVDLTAAATGTPHNGFTRSYAALTRDAGLVPRYPQRNQIQVTPPGGQIGARGSRLMRLVGAGHYEVKLSDQEFRTLAAWIDLNAVFYGSYDPEENARELAGQSIRMPRIQ